MDIQVCKFNKKIKNVAEICEITENSNYYEFAERLVNCANNNGGGDNITVVTLSY